MTGELIERLEAAEAGSRELDLAVTHVTGGTFAYTDRRSDDGTWSKVDIACPAYTTSLDAIIALIGEKLPRWSWGAEGKGQAAIASPDDKPAIVFGAFAKTAPLALCIALLRALSKEGEPNV